MHRTNAFGTDNVITETFGKQWIQQQDNAREINACVLMRKTKPQKTKKKQQKKQRKTKQKMN